MGSDHGTQNILAASLKECVWLDLSHWVKSKFKTISVILLVIFPTWDQHKWVDVFHLIHIWDEEDNKHKQQKCTQQKIKKHHVINLGGSVFDYQVKHIQSGSCLFKYPLITL